MRTELLALIAFAGCKCGNEAPRARVADPAPKVKGAGTAQAPLAQKEFFRVDVAANQPACQVEAPCEARLILTALGDYHVNENYPFKLEATAPDITVDGTGSFEPNGKTGTMALAFRASKPGTAKLAGTFKLSVCNDDNCQIEAAKVAFEVPVRPAN